MANIKTLYIERPFQLENGSTLPGLEIAYHTYGVPTADQSNTVWVFHALTANADPCEWWPGLAGHGCLLDPQHYYIVCANIIGSCYGSSGPLTSYPGRSRPWYADFPQVSVRDMVRAHDVLRQHLGIERIFLGIGGSMGGQQALEWALARTDLFDNLVLLACNARHSPWGIAFNTAQRMALETDPSLYDEHPEAGAQGLQAARAVAMLSYRHYEAFRLTQADAPDAIADFRADSYLRYQGRKLAWRFNAASYRLLTKAMDSHDVGRGRSGTESALRGIRARALVVGIRSDMLFPPAEQQFLAAHIPNAMYREIDSAYGHDGFLIETQQLTTIISEFLNCNKKD